MAADQQMVFEILARSRDEATAGLQVVEQSIARVGNTTASQLSLMRRAMADLDPALGRVVGLFEVGARRMSALGTAFTVTATAVGIATAVYAAHRAAMERVVEIQTSLNLAVRALDTKAIVGQLTQLGSTIERLKVQAALAPTLADLVLPEQEPGRPGFLKRLDETLPKLRAFGDALQRIIAGIVGDSRQQAALLEQEFARVGEALRRTLPHERARVAAEIGAADVTARQQILQAQLGGIQTGREPIIGRIGIGLGGDADAQALVLGQKFLTAQQQEERLLEIEHELTREYVTEAAALRDVIGKRREAALAALPPGAPPEAREAVELQFKPEFAKIDRGLAQSRFALSATVSGGIESVAARRTAELKALLDLEMRRLDVAREVQGLSVREQEALDEQVARRKDIVQLAELERQLAEAIGRGDATRVELLEKQRELLQTGAARRAANLSIQVGVREDPALGLLQGLRQVEDEFGGIGTSMQNIAVATARGMHRAFADGFLAPFQKDLAKLPPFLQSLFGTIASEVAKQLTLPLVQAVRNAFTGGAVPGPFGTSPSGLDVSSASPQTLAALQLQGYQVVAGAGGKSIAVPGPAGAVPYPSAEPVSSVSIPFSVGLPSRTTALFGPLIGQAFQTNLEAGLQSGAVIVQNGQIISSGSELALTGAASPGVYGATAGADTGGAVLAGVGSVVGVIGAAYGAYQAGRAGAGTTSAITQGAISGLLSGGPIGLVVGALAGWAGAEEYEGMTARYHRRRQRRRDASRIVQGIGAAIDALQKTGLADLDAALATRLVSGNSVGGLLLAMAQTVGDAELAAYLRERGMAPEGFNWEGLNNIHELLGNIGDATAVMDFLTGVLSALQGLQAREEGALFGYVEREPTAGVTRTTYLPATALAGVPADRQDIFVSTPLLRNQGYDDDFIAYLIRRIQEVNIRKDMVVDLSATDFLAVT